MLIKLTPLSPAISLALRITMSILGILLGILCIFIAIAYDRSEHEVKQLLLERLDQIETRPRLIPTILADRTQSRPQRPGWSARPDWEWELEQERIPPFARNTIIFGPNKSMATGFLGNSWMDLSVLRGVQADTFELLNIAGEGQIYIVGRSMGKFMIYSYEPAELTRNIGSKFLLWGAFCVVLFAAGIFGLSLRIARHTLAPIEAARERSKSYNRYLAHELKTPLSIVMSELELARATATYDADLNTSSLEEIHSMSDIISGLLLLSEAERSPSRSQVSLCVAVQSITSELQKIATYHDRVFEISIPSEAYVMAEPILLHTLIKNLLLNALKHGAPGIITIAHIPKGLLLSNPLLPNTQLNLPGIFEEFTGTPGAGNGLGLSLCKRIADMHGWKLTLEQTPHLRLEAKMSFER